MVWYLDSGTSMHMMMHRDWLQDVIAPPVQNIRIAENKVLQVESCGNQSTCWRHQPYTGVKLSPREESSVCISCIEEKKKGNPSLVMASGQAHCYS